VRCIDRGRFFVAIFKVRDVDVNVDTACNIVRLCCRGEIQRTGRDADADVSADDETVKGVGADAVVDAANNVS